MLTIDANVFVSAAIASEIHHHESAQLLTEIRSRTEAVACPSLVIPETVAAISRPTGDIRAAIRAGRQISALPTIRMQPLTARRAQRAARLAAHHRLRGADSVYVQLAVELGATLITWDIEMLIRASPVVTALTPTDWLAANPI